jgi:hypothetical protein
MAERLADGPLAELADALGPMVVEEPPAEPIAAELLPIDAGILAPAGAAVPTPARRAAPAVSAARVDPERGEVVLTLDSGARVAVPWVLFPALSAAPVDGRAGVQVAEDGALLQWPALRLEVSVRELLQRALGLPA